MENKNEKSMTLEEMIGEILKDAKVVKIPVQPKQDAGQEVQEQDKPQQVRPSGTPFISLNIENLHLHMDERMTSYNYGIGQEPTKDVSADTEDDPAEDIDFDDMLERIKKETGLCEKVILAVLQAQSNYLDDLWGDEVSDEEDKA